MKEFSATRSETPDAPIPCAAIVSKVSFALVIAVGSRVPKILLKSVLRAVFSPPATSAFPRFIPSATVGEIRLEIS